MAASVQDGNATCGAARASKPDLSRDRRFICYSNKPHSRGVNASYYNLSMATITPAHNKLRGRNTPYGCEIMIARDARRRKQDDGLNDKKKRGAVVLGASLEGSP